MVCFRVDSKDSFISTYSEWLPELAIEKQITRDIPKILVGLCTDVKPDRRIISKADAEKTMATHGFERYVECSALTFTNLEDVFHAAA